MGFVVVCKVWRSELIAVDGPGSTSRLSSRMLMFLSWLPSLFLAFLNLFSFTGYYPAALNNLFINM